MNAQKTKSHLIFLAALFCFCTAPISGQTAAPEDQTKIVRNFELNIAEDRITETNFERSTAAELNGESLTLRVGAGVGAERIDVILRGITGTIRFRASLEQIRARLNRLPQAAPAVPPAP